MTEELELSPYVIKEKAYSSREPYKGYTVTAFYLETPAGEALVEIYKEGKCLRRFFFPAYKIWNVAAHFEDIVEGELKGSGEGYRMASWTGF